jgi:hypothetical protein
VALVADNRDSIREVAVGGLVAIPVRARYQDGHSDYYGGVQWAAADPHILAVVADGSIVAQAPGTTTLTGAACTKTETVSITVATGAPRYRQLLCRGMQQQIDALRTANLDCFAAPPITQPCSLEQAAWDSANAAWATCSVQTSGQDCSAANADLATKTQALQACAAVRLVGGKDCTAPIRALASACASYKGSSCADMPEAACGS